MDSIGIAGSRTVFHPGAAAPHDRSLSSVIPYNPVDGLLRGDYASRMSGYATARQNGWMSANDIRELENLDRIPADLGGDLYLINGNMTKLEDAGLFANKKSDGEEEKSDEEVLELEESDRDEPGNEGTDGGENTVPKRHHSRRELV